MRRRVLHTCLATVVVSGALATVAASPGTAATGDAVGAALGLPSGVTATVAGPDGSSMVTGTSFGDFPRRSPAGAAAGDVHGTDGQYLVLSTGLASDLFSTTGAGAQPSTDLPGDDVATLTLDVAAADARRCLVLDLAMVTEERVHTYTAATPSDTISVRRAGDDTEYAMQAGPQLFAQGSTRPRPVPFQVNTIDYWHDPGDEADRAVGSSKDSWMPKGTTPFDHATTPETIEVPLPAGAGQSVSVSVADVGNQRLDSVALVDHVRVLPRCSTDPGLDTGLFVPTMTIRGDRGVGNSLTLDPVAATPDVERYDALDNGWYAADERGVELRFRWYRYKQAVGGKMCESTDISLWEAIPDADRQTYVPSVKDKGHCLIALVTGRKDGWRTETFPSPETSWNPTLQIGDGQFVDTYQPQVLDKQSSVVPTTITNGQQLTAETRDFAPLQDHFDYQWRADGVNIVGAQGKDFTVTEAQAGKRISVRVTAQRLYFDPMPSESERTAAVELLTMSSTPVPAITGTPTVGSQIGYEMPPWEPAGVSFSQRWYVDGVVQSTTGSTFTLKPEHAGKQVTVAVTGNRSGYQPVTRTSAPVTVGAAAMQPGSPVVSGTPKVGQSLRGSVSSWSPAGATYTYTWTAGSVVLQTGNDSAARTLVVPAAAAGRTIVLTVEAAKDGYVTTSRSSAPTAVVAKGTLTSYAPRISGRAKVGQTLRVSTSAWRPSPVRLTYRWYANGRAISGATRTTYRVPKAARGKRITVKVTGTRSGYTTVTRTSSATSRVAR